jgi:hypothetical protein
MRSFASLVAVLCFVVAGVARAGNPAEVLIEGMFATGDGCKAIETTLPEEIEDMDFMVMSNTELMGRDFVCHFKDADALATNSGKAWTVNGECESDAPSEPGTLAIKQMSDVTLATVGPPDHLGAFTFCPNPLTD